MSWFGKILGFFGLQIEKIKKCSMCSGQMSAEPAVVVLNDETEIEVCDICEKILDMSNKAAHSARVREPRDGDESI